MKCVLALAKGGVWKKTEQNYVALSDLMPVQDLDTNPDPLIGAD